ncbi:DUF4390 domain-containing protein [Craterilacuibacter sp. RT1T]|uniref:DUF4390 domain-containing protein n=1 Tax=Craterilacuibacter sp. RT1T TaxID=2942211 RepID=UPI0020C0B4FD|nr:DUF4390 domain-containing protein [Craterilacuibacter sp. RT1T]MCL6263979.1 DUF4390 domain-containing protein [Craterilacuibacter sp. RT1T]
MTASITHWLKKLSLGLLLACSLATPVLADDIRAQKAEAEISDGKLQLATRFVTDLPPDLSEALQQGVPLTFKLEFDLTRPRAYAYYTTLRDWFEPMAALDFRLSYYRFTNRYRVSIGSLSTHYATLDEALRAVGNISSWTVLDVSDWDSSETRRLAGRVRLSLDIGALPRPFQLNAFGSRDWTLASDWTDVKFNRK